VRVTAYECKPRDPRIEKERNRQIKEEGFDAEHDDSYRAGDLGMGAAAYIMSACTNEPFPEGWMWQLSSVYKRRVPTATLIKAAAMIVAEIERLDRASIKG
jgi:hypothetical protein